MGGSVREAEVWPWSQRSEVLKGCGNCHSGMGVLVLDAVEKDFLAVDSSAQTAPVCRVYDEEPLTVLGVGSSDSCSLALAVLTCCTSDPGSPTGDAPRSGAASCSCDCRREGALGVTWWLLVAFPGLLSQPRVLSPC